jgi:uroporphyrin-III C-methyltransferase/precorrin-2 dehydrogenase/sirohydrochlorin ferrochelatase
MDALPIFMRIKGRRCLVVGGGEVAARKVTMLRKAGGDVLVVSPALHHELTAMVEAGQIIHQADVFRAEQLDGACLVIAATDDEQVNRAVYAEANIRHLPVNVVDCTELCTFTMPSIVERYPLTIAISSGGAAPVLARMIRARIETLVPATYGRLASIAAEYRDKVKARFATTQERRIFWESVFQGPIGERVLSGQEATARAALEQVLSGEADAQDHGEV